MKLFDLPICSVKHSWCYIKLNQLQPGSSCSNDSDNVKTQELQFYMILSEL